MKTNTTKRASLIAVGVSTFILTASGVRADEAQPVALPKLCVGKFEPVERAPNGFGPLHALNADIRRMKARPDAAVNHEFVGKSGKNPPPGAL